MAPPASRSRLSVHAQLPPAPQTQPLLLLLLTLGALRLVAGQLRIMAPNSLVNKLSVTEGRIDGSTATFGAPFYGQRLLGKLVYGRSNGSHAHCKAEEYNVPQPDLSSTVTHENREMPLIHIILVRRGECTFVTKVRVAQEKGAHAVIIVDTEGSNLTRSDIQRIIVADDGYGSSIDIPSMLITAQEGEYLIDAVSHGSEVIVELAWDVPTDHVVLVDLWMSSASQESNHFLKTFSANRKQLNDAIKFVPHYHVFGMDSSTAYNELCSDKSAEYCAEDPDGSGPITGAMVLDEDVRQLCIHELYKITRERGEIAEIVVRSQHKVEYAREFWDYVELFLDRCPITGADPSSTFGKVCSEKIMHQVGIDPSRVEDCVIRTHSQKLKEQRENIAWSPRALRINGWRYSGQLDADLVTRAVCAGFIHQPLACEKLTEPVHPVLRQMVQKSGGVSFSSFLTALFVVALVAVAALLFYKRSLTRHIHRALREEVMLEVQAQMDSYKQLS